MTTRKAPPAAESTKRARADAALEEPNKRARAEAAPQLSQETSTSPVPIKRARVDAATGDEPQAAVGGGGGSARGGGGGGA